MKRFNFNLNMAYLRSSSYEDFGAHLRVSCDISERKNVSKEVYGKNSNTLCVQTVFSTSDPILYAIKQK
jgi:hypothetical protein